MISVLYFIKKISAEYSNNNNNIATKGSNIEECIELTPDILILAGWCKVFHHSTEYFIIGRLMEPTIAINEHVFVESDSSLISLDAKM